MTTNKFNFHSHYKNRKEEKKTKLHICQDNSKEDTKFICSLETPKEIKKRTFTPKLTPSLKQKRINFTPSLEMPKESSHRNFTPTLTIDTKKKQRTFTPSLEMPKMKKKAFILDYNAKNENAQHIKNEKFNPNQIKEELKNFNCKTLSNNWVITSNNKEIQLDPTKEPSKNNPLYRHKEWLYYVYNNQSWNLNDTQLAKICGVTSSVIGKWRSKYQIKTKQIFFQKKLYNNGTRKECGRCHKIKPQFEFKIRRDNRNKKEYLRNTLKNANSKINKFML